jgi:hypothetical protein
MLSDGCALFFLRFRWPGLRYDDLYDDLNDLDIKEALNRLPQQEVDARNQRLKRAMDCSMKHAYLPKDLQVGVHFSLPFVEFLPLSVTPFKSARFSSSDRSEALAE